VLVGRAAGQHRARWGRCITSRTAGLPLAVLEDRPLRREPTVGAF